MEENKIEIQPEPTDVCEQCGNILDEHAENGYCFTCVMAACTPGNHY